MGKKEISRDLNEYEVEGVTSKGSRFRISFIKVIEHDRKLFGEPQGWNEKKISESPLIKIFDIIWDKLNITYTKELSMLAYTEIPDKNDIAKKFKELVSILKEINE